MLSDLTQSINKFSRGNPLTLIENLGEDRWVQNPTRDPNESRRYCSVEEAAANEDQRKNPCEGKQVTFQLDSLTISSDSTAIESSKWPQLVKDSIAYGVVHQPRSRMPRVDSN
jgi:hypothetical protein